MGYGEAKADRIFVDEFSGKLADFLAIEAKAKAKVDAEGSLLGTPMGYGTQPSTLKRVIRNEASEMDGKYPGLRDYLSQNMEKLKSIARKHSVPQDGETYLPSAVDVPAIPINIFDSVLENNSYVNIDSQTVHDKMQAVIGACKEYEELEFRALLNPLRWFKNLLFFVLRSPFMLLEATGFDVGKIENNVFGHVAKGAILLFIIWIAMNWFGFSKDDIIRMMGSQPQ